MALLQKCLIDVVHHYPYPSAQFDENYTSVQFVETILWLNLMNVVTLRVNEQCTGPHSPLA